MKKLQNKRIGIVLPALPGYSETFFRSKIAGLQKNGAEVIIFVVNSKKAKEEHFCTTFYAPKLRGNRFVLMLTIVIEFSKAVMFNFYTSMKFLNLEREDRITLKNRLKHLIANQFILKHKLDWLHFGFGTMAIERENVAEAINAKMAVSFRGFDHYVYPLKNPNCYQSLFTKKVKFHVLSDGMRSSLLKKGVTRNAIEIITPAIDITLFKNDANFLSNTLNIVTVARLHWIKGLEYILHGLLILKNNGVDFHYMIIGDGPELERLIFAAYQLGLEKNVTFAGKLSPNEVKEQMSKATVYVQYSIQEGFCNAALEAQAMGLLCIVSDAEGLIENVVDNQTGWVIPKRNPALLAEKLKEVISLSEAEKTKISDNAAGRVRIEFNIEKQTLAFLEFYEN